MALCTRLRRTTGASGRVLGKHSPEGEKTGEEVYKKAREIVEKEASRGTSTLKNKKEVGVNGKRHVVRVLFWDVDAGSLLKIIITAEVDGAVRVYKTTFRKRSGRVVGECYANVDAPGGREADAKRFAAVVKAVTGKEPKMYAMGRRLEFSLGRTHLDGFAQYAELADIVEGWLVGAWAVAG
jgi:hypothetical protein